MPVRPAAARRRSGGNEYARNVSDTWIADTLEQLRTAANTPAGAAGVLAHQGRLDYRRGRFGDAIDRCRAALRLLEDGWLRHECRIWLAASLIERGRHAEARPVLDVITASSSAAPDQRERAEQLRALMPR